MPHSLPSRLYVVSAVAALVAAATAREVLAQGATVVFDAELAKVASKPHVPFSAGGVQWSCTTTHCGGKGPGSDPVGTCKAITQQVGPLKSFFAAGRAIDMKACAAAAPVGVVAPMKSSAAIASVPAASAVHTAPSPKPTPKPPPPAPAPAPTSAPHKKSTPPAPPTPAAPASTSGLAFTVPVFTLTGTGAAPAAPATSGLAWSTPVFSLAGTGAAPGATTAEPLAFTTDTFRLSGSPP